MNIDWLFKNLSKAVSEQPDDFFDNILYLDTEQLMAMYSGLTGLRERPKVEVKNINGEYRSSLITNGETDASSQIFELGDSHLLRAMLPGLKMAYQRVTDPHVMKSAQKQRIWIEGTLRNTLYVLPRGLRCGGRTSALLLELVQNDMRCSVTLMNEYVSSIYRPFILEERTFEEKADLFGYLHSCEEKKVAVSSVKEKIVLEALVTPIVILRQ